MIGHQAEDAASFQSRRRDLQKLAIHQPAKPMPSLRPGIGKGDMEHIKESLRDQGLQRFFPPPSPHSSVAEAQAIDFPIAPSDAVGKPLDAGEEDSGIQGRALAQELPLRGPEVALDSGIGRRRKNQFGAGLSEILIRRHPSRDRYLFEISLPDHGIRQRPCPDGGGSSGTFAPR